MSCLAQLILGSKVARLRSAAAQSCLCQTSKELSDWGPQHAALQGSVLRSRDLRMLGVPAQVEIPQQPPVKHNGQFVLTTAVLENKILIPSADDSGQTSAANVSLHADAGHVRSRSPKNVFAPNLDS